MLLPIRCEYEFDLSTDSYKAGQCCHSIDTAERLPSHNQSELRQSISATSHSARLICSVTIPSFVFKRSFLSALLELAIATSSSAFFLCSFVRTFCTSLGLILLALPRWRRSL